MPVKLFCTDAGAEEFTEAALAASGLAGGGGAFCCC